MFSRHHRLLPMGFATIVALAASVAFASTYTAAPPVLGSGPSPFAACTVGGTGSGILYVNAEVEPRVDANPANPNNLVGVFQQDRWSDGGAHGLVTAVTHDGGTTWNRTWAHFTTCSGGTAANGGDFDRASDPWVSFAPNGEAYQISLSVSADQRTSGILVSKSTNGGDTWSEPTTLIRETSDFNFNDKESIAADPTNASRVYAVWDRSRFPSDKADFNALHSSAFRGDIIFSRTTDGGATWEKWRDILPGNGNLWTIGNQIVVLPDGTLVDVFNMSRGSGVQPSNNQYMQAVIRSTDHGVTWSKPIVISTEQAVLTVDPDTGAPLRTSDFIPDIAVNRQTGALYVVWQDSRFTRGAYNDIVLSKSTDGGLSWTAPVKVNQTPSGIAAFTPTVRVAADGTVGVTYYDFRNNNSSPGLPTDYFLVHSHDGGQTWGETHASGPFDVETAPVARGYFLGDYQGLTSVGNNFLPFFVQANSGDTANRTDVFATRITTP